MVNLAILEDEQGNLDQARHWYRQAIASDHPKMTGAAQSRLRTLNQRQKDRQKAERFGRYGYLAYADPAMMEQPEHIQTPPAATDPPPATSERDNEDP
jgi:TPR repeat protein